MAHIQQHVDESLKLEADSYIDLFEIHLTDGATVIRINNYKDYTWQGNLYEGLACQLQGEVQSADEEANRPTLTIMNPGGIFKPYISTNVVDGATIVRKRLLRSLLEQNVNLCEQRQWFVGRVSTLTTQFIGLELRNLSDGPNSTIPARMYYPPMFPVVSL